MNDLLKGFLIFLAVGIIFGFFPAWFSCTAVIINGIKERRKAIPRWMINNSWPNPYNPTSLSISFIPDKIYPVFYYVLSLL